ncbi:GtrA family protein [Vibrio harveyi]|jgi:putative flippase GtrA|uniref:GtrA family protein n=2 Tax=Vibrio harveyi TaxID=669 RepID=A0ABN4KY09_VIBHA|nr:GtrA family protein [Vibrio harveyi]AMF96861.1 GtrA family protein [Vibrio harveyi]EKO3832568.1 GtrA family protein [Vibrio harveyi]EKO3840557.1 GtrA family protein [Vibrio harveyi]EKY4197818.1 GtrA family protein [Vibrio harveyi]ELC3157194.1 GtrA family protein [Vibrio harveyi]
MSRLLTFAMVGGVGFIVDTLIFMVLFQWAGVELMIARGLAFCVAATTTWLGNRCLTFSQSTKDRAFNQWQKFMLSASISALPNFAVFKVTTLLLGTQGTTVYIALVMGILAGMVSNYLLSMHWVFQQSSK